jgi:hypothetical protein
VGAPQQLRVRWQPWLLQRLVVALLAALAGRARQTLVALPATICALVLC